VSVVSVTCGFSGHGCIILIAVLGVKGAGILYLFFLTIPSFFPPSIHRITTFFCFFFFSVFEPIVGDRVGFLAHGAAVLVIGFSGVQRGEWEFRARGSGI